MSRPGTTIVIDNVIREGGVLDAASGDERIQGTRRLFEEVGREPRLTATAVQTVGIKKWDGFLIAVVDRCPQIPLPLWEREGAAQPRKGEGDSFDLNPFPLIPPPRKRGSPLLPQGEKGNGSFAQVNLREVSAHP